MKLVHQIHSKLSIYVWGTADGVISFNVEDSLGRFTTTRFFAIFNAKFSSSAESVSSPTISSALNSFLTSADFEREGFIGSKLMTSEIFVQSAINCCKNK